MPNPIRIQSTSSGRTEREFGVLVIQLEFVKAAEESEKVTSVGGVSNLKGAMGWTVDWVRSGGYQRRWKSLWGLEDSLEVAWKSPTPMRSFLK